MTRKPDWAMKKVSKVLENLGHRMQGAWPEPMASLLRAERRRAVRVLRALPVKHLPAFAGISLYSNGYRQAIDDAIAAVKGEK